MGTNAQESVTGHKKARNLRFPAFITLALNVTRCHRCEGLPLILSAVIDGIEHHLDVLPLAHAGLVAAAAAGNRYVAVVRPWGPPLAHRAVPGHWWVSGALNTAPTLLAAHVHGQPALPHDPELASALLTRFLPDDAQVHDPNEPCPF